MEGSRLTLLQRSLLGSVTIAGRYLAGRADASLAAHHWLDAPASSWRRSALWFCSLSLLLVADFAHQQSIHTNQLLCLGAASC